MGGVQPGRFDHHQARLAQAYALQLITLPRRRQVLHHEDEVAGGLVHVGEPASRRVDQGGRRQLLIEPHLAQIVAEHDAGLAALGVGRRELAHQGGRRIVAAAGIVQGEADAVADLAGADGLGGKILDHGVGAAGLKNRSQPVGVDVARLADVGAT